MAQASEKQIRFALSLLGKAGYGTKWMNAEYKKLGVSMRDRVGTVENWLAGLSSFECSRLIDQLKNS